MKQLINSFDTFRISRTRYVMCLALAGIVFLGCKGSKTKLLPKKNMGIIYDTSYKPKSNNSQGSVFSAHFDQLHHRYHLTLAEPVAVTRWSSNESTWQIFFATNRGGKPASDVQPDSTADVTQYFGNDVLKSVRFGQAETVVSGRKRGENSSQKQSQPKLLGIVPVGFDKKTEQSSGIARIDRIQELQSNEFLKRLNKQITQSPGKDLLVFVHGFNVDYTSSLIRGAQISLDLPFNGAICCYSWPSQGGVTNYDEDEQISKDSVEPFTDFLQTLIHGVPEETRIQLVVHSMGNRVVMQALNRLPLNENRDKPFENVVLCAPDVGLANYRSWIGRVKQQAKQVTLYVCSGDTALVVSKALHSEQRAGDALPPVIVQGVETIDCSSVDYSFMGHSYYGGNISVLSDLFSIIKEQKHAQQREWLSRQTDSQGKEFWKFTSQPTPIHWTWNFKEPILQQVSHEAPAWKRTEIPARIVSE